MVEERIGFAHKISIRKDIPEGEVTLGEWFCLGLWRKFGKNFDFLKVWCQEVD